MSSYPHLLLFQGVALVLVSWWTVRFASTRRRHELTAPRPLCARARVCVCPQALKFAALLAVLCAAALALALLFYGDLWAVLAALWAALQWAIAHPTAAVLLALLALCALVALTACCCCGGRARATAQSTAPVGASADACPPQLSFSGTFIVLPEDNNSARQLLRSLSEYRLDPTAPTAPTAAAVQSAAHHRVRSTAGGDVTAHHSRDSSAASVASVVSDVHALSTA